MGLFKNIISATRAYDETYIENDEAPKPAAEAEGESSEEYAGARPKPGFFIRREHTSEPVEEPVQTPIHTPGRRGRRAPEPAPAADTRPIKKEPKCYEDVYGIAKLVRVRPVIINLEGVDEQTGHDISCFLSGFVYGIGGMVEKISRYVYTLSPVGAAFDGEAAVEFENDDFSF